LIDAGKVTDFKEEQFAKALFPIAQTPSENFKEVSIVQLRKALSGTLVRAEGISTERSTEQSLNASLPSNCKLGGKNKVANELQPAKALHPID
jgi:hypothetical protein